MLAILASQVADGFVLGDVLIIADFLLAGAIDPASGSGVWSWRSGVAG